MQPRIYVGWSSRISMQSEIDHAELDEWHSRHVTSGKFEDEKQATPKSLVKALIHTAY